jgi:hypothetical protein
MKGLKEDDPDLFYKWLLVYVNGKKQKAPAVFSKGF